MRKPGRQEGNSAEERQNLRWAQMWEGMNYVSRERDVDSALSADLEHGLSQSPQRIRKTHCHEVTM